MTVDERTREVHPLTLFAPEGARLLMLGSFPPPRERWRMDFFYPNFQNDMWRIFGHVFFGDKLHFVDQEHKTFHLKALKAFLTETGVAIFDTGLRIRRTKNNASDKDLEIVEQADIDGLLRQLPECKGVLAAGQLATQVFMQHFGIKQMPKMGCFAEFSFEGRTLRLYRVPSSSRAYPMAVEKKAAFYQKMFDDVLR